MIVAFDLDGTTLDSMGELEALAVSYMCEGYGVEQELARCWYRQSVGLPFREQLETTALPGHLANPEIARRFERDKAKIYVGLPLFPEVQGVMSSLEHLAVDTALVSSTKTALVERVADRWQLPCLTYGYDGRRRWSKTRQLESLAITYDDVLFVGDARSDLDTALRAGVRFVGINRGAPWSYFGLGVVVVNDLYDVLGCLK